MPPRPQYHRHQREILPGGRAVRAARPAAGGEVVNARQFQWRATARDHYVTIGWRGSRTVASVTADPPRHRAGRAFPASPNLWRSLSPDGHRQGGWNHPTAANSHWLTRPARASPTLPGLGATRRSTQNASSRTGPSTCWCARRRASPRCCHGIAARHTPESSTNPARPRQRPLGRHRARSAPARGPKTACSRRPEMLPADSYISRCQRRAPGLRVAIGSLDGSPMEPPASRPGSRFGRTGRTRWVLFTPGAGPTSRPLTPVSPTSTPDIPASPAGQPMPLLAAAA